MNPHKALGRRIVAFILDGLILTAINAALFFPFAKTDEEIAAEVASGELDPTSNAYVNVTLGDSTYSIVGGSAGLFFLATIVVTLLYWVVLVGRTGLTGGKAITGVRVVRDGDPHSPPGMGRAFLRHLLWIVDSFPYLIPGLMGYVVALTNPRRRRVGDMAAGTMVIQRNAVGEAAPQQSYPEPVAAAEPPRMGTQAMPAIAVSRPEPPPLPPPSSGPPADWYPDPHGQKRLRYWDGSAWTDHTAE